MSILTMMNTKVMKFLLVITLILSLNISQVMHVSTASQSKVSLMSNVSAELFDVEYLTQENGKLVTFTLEIQNNSSKSLPLIDYWAKIKTSKKSYITKLIETDKTKELVPVNATQYLTFYAQVEKDVSISDLYIDIIKWDFNASNYETKLGTLTTNGFSNAAYKAKKNITINNQKLELSMTDYKMYRDDKYGYINMALIMTNKSSISQNLEGVSYQMVAGGSKVYSVDPVYTEVTLKANETIELIVTATVPIEDLKKPLELQAYYSKETTVVPLITINLPTLQDTVALTIDKSRLISINGNEIQFNANKSSVATNENRTEFKTTMTLLNKGSAQFEVNNIYYYVKTKEGYLYPLTIAADSKVTLLPGIKKDVEISGQIPNAGVLSTSQLVIFYENETSKAKSFLGNFKIVLKGDEVPDSSNEGSKKVTYSGLTIEQVSLQRTPNDMNDLLIAEYLVTNTSKAARGKLDMAGQFILDGVKLKETATTFLDMDGLLAIAPGASYRVLAYTKIPYTQDVKTYKFGMTDITDPEDKKQIHTFAESILQNAKLLGVNQSYSIATVGQRATVDVISSQLYEGVGSNLLYTQVEYTNNEKRAVAPGSLTGYLSNAKGDIIDLSFAESKDKLLPGATMTLSAWSVIPKNFEDKKVEIHFGEAITLGEDSAVAMLSPVYTAHTFKPSVVKDSFTDLSLMNYLIDLEYFTVLYGSSDEFELDTLEMYFDYSMKLNENVTSYPKEHQLLVEFEDSTAPKIVFSKLFTLGGGDKDENKFVLDNGREVKLSFTSKLVTNKNIKEYNVNVYDVVDGYKHKIASKTLILN